MKENKNHSFIKCFEIFVCVSIITFFGASCRRDSSSKAGQLTPENPLTQKIMNDEVHTFTADLEKGQFVNLAVEQRDVDVITKIFAPTGELIGEFDTPTSGRGTEQIRLGTDAAGEYRIEIYTLSERTEPGEYKLSIADFHPLKTRDQKILTAVKFHQEADGLRSKPETCRDSIAVYEKALAVWRELDEKADEANTLRAMGFAYQRENELEKAKEHFGKALEIWQQNNDLRSAAFTHIIFGVIAKKQNDLKGGLQEDLKAQPLWEQANDLPEATQNLVRLGADYVKLQNKDEALKYFAQALENTSRVEKKSVKAYVLMEYGKAHSAFGNKNEALNFYRQSLDLWKTLNNEKVVVDLEEKVTKLQTN
ncbi:MAG: tetratricopeptide repeat protein [Acidobacteriota bacterium]|nr:tetratricopeptide repeat protein [Acidobacteriota bacterium]